METRYYIAGKQSWSDVTISVNRKNTPKKGDVVNVGKIKMTVKDVVDGTVHGKPVTKVMLESTGLPFTQIDEAIEQMESPIFLEIDEGVNEARKMRSGDNPSDKRVFTSPEPWSDSAPYPTIANAMGSVGSLGGYFRSGLANLGAGYGVTVSDFGEAVTINITYSNATSCATAGLNFVVIFRGKDKKYTYTVYANSARFRHCSDYNAALNFIRSKASVLSNRASNGV